MHGIFYTVIMIGITQTDKQVAFIGVGFKILEKIIKASCGSN